MKIPAMTGAQIFKYKYRELYMVVKNDGKMLGGIEEAGVQPGQCDTRY